VVNELANKARPQRKKPTKKPKEAIQTNTIESKDAKGPVKRSTPNIKMHFQPAVKNPSNPPAVKTPSNLLELDDAIDAPSTSNTTQSPQSSGTSLSGTLAAESSEESLDELDPQADSAVELSKDPKVYSWVGVRIYRTVKLARGRSTKSPYIHIGKV
ncbi:unnamed protein product, partial [Meganyctiphanes norvegica]